MPTAKDPGWDHLRIFLAVMRETSLRKAAERLEVSHPTLRRRLEELEEHLGLRLFDRRPDGLHPTPEASALLAKAEQVEASVQSLYRSAENFDHSLEGKIHITAPDLVMSELLAPDLAAFSARWPQISLHIETTYELADLGSREADVGIRIVMLGQSPPDDLLGRKAATLSMAIYGRPHQWIGWWEDGSDRNWMDQYDFPELPLRNTMSNIYLQKAACLAGMGLARLPCFMATSEMERHTEPRPVAALWVLVHPNLRKHPRIRLFRDEIVAAIKRHAPVLEGKQTLS